MHYLLSIYLTINLYIFWAGLLLIIRLVWILLAASQHKCKIHTNRCIYRLASPDDEQ